MMVNVFDTIIYALGRLRDYIGEFTGWCSRKASEWENAWVFGPIISEVLWYFYAVGWDVRWAIIDIRSAMHPLGTFISDLEVGDAIENVILGLWGDWNNFISDPWAWFTYQAWTRNPKVFYLLLEPWVTIRAWIENEWPDIGGIGEASSQWIFDRLVEIWPDLYWLYQDPFWMLEYWFISSFPFLNDFLYNPDAWIAARIPHVDIDIGQWIEDHLLDAIENIIIKDWDTR